MISLEFCCLDSRMAEVKHKRPVASLTHVSDCMSIARDPDPKIPASRTTRRKSKITRRIS